MNDFTIAIYCFVDDLLLKIDDKSLDKRRKLTNYQIITTVLIFSKYFCGNQVSACAYLESHHGFAIPDNSNRMANRFNRILHSLTDSLADLFIAVSVIFKNLNINIQMNSAKLVKGEEFIGYDASKREYFHEFKSAVAPLTSLLQVKEFLLSFDDRWQYS